MQAPSTVRRSALQLRAEQCTASDTQEQRTAGCNQFLCSKRLICAAVHGWKTVVHTERTYSEPSLAEAICVNVNTCTKPVYFVGAKICGCNHAVVLCMHAARFPVFLSGPLQNNPRIPGILSKVISCIVILYDSRRFSITIAVFTRSCARISLLLLSLQQSSDHKHLPSRFRPKTSMIRA